MAVMNATDLSLAEVLKATGANDKQMAVAELLAQTNEMVEDIPFMPTNHNTKHIVGIRTGLPTVYYRLLGRGVPRSKSRMTTVEETCALMEGYSQVDTQVARLSGDEAGVRSSEDIAFIEAMNQSFQGKFLYGTAANPEEFVGLAPRYSSLSADNADNIINAGGSGSDNTSVWLVGWGEQGVYGLYPKNTQAGIEVRDLGEDTVQDSDGNDMQVFRSHYRWYHGLCVKDWRYAVRIANIDVSNLVSESSATDLFKNMISAIERIPAPGLVKLAFYVNRTVREKFLHQTYNKSASNSGLTIENAVNQFGMQMRELRFQGIPIRKVDQILTTEAAVA